MSIVGGTLTGLVTKDSDVPVPTTFVSDVARKATGKELAGSKSTTTITTTMITNKDKCIYYSFNDKIVFLREKAKAYINSELDSCHVKGRLQKG